MCCEKSRGLAWKLELIRSTQIGTLIAPERPVAVRVVKSVVCTVRYVLRLDVSNTYSCADILSVLRLHKPPASPRSHASRARAPWQGVACSMHGHRRLCHRAHSRDTWHICQRLLAHTAERAAHHHVPRRRCCSFKQRQRPGSTRLVPSAAPSVADGRVSTASAKRRAHANILTGVRAATEARWRS